MTNTSGKSPAGADVAGGGAGANAAPSPVVTPEQLHILQHSLGVDQYGLGEHYRNHFVTGQGTTDYPHCIALFEMGMMGKRNPTRLSGGDDVFFVTKTGKEYVRDHSPKPPVQTRSQKRYQEFLNLDTGWSFREFLKSGIAK